MAVTDRYILATEHLMNQFQNSVDFKKLLRVAFNRILDSDEVLYNLENKTDINNATGVWLDILGRIVGLKRPPAEFDQNKLFTYGAIGVSDPLKGYCGTEELTDGDMEAAGAAAWTANFATLSKQTTTPAEGTRLLRVAYNGTAGLVSAYQSVMTISDNYRAAGWARSDGTQLPALHTGGSQPWTGTLSTEWQKFDVDFVAITANMHFGSNPCDGGYVEFDDVTTILDGGYYQSFVGLPAADGSFMSDTNFRQLVLAKAAANFAVGTIPDIYAFVNTAFGLTPLVYNGATRNVTIKIGSVISQNKKYLIETLGPRLAGVALGVIE